MKTYTKSYDYRTELTKLNLSELKYKLNTLELEWDKWFCMAFAEEQEAKVLKKIGYVKNRIEKLS